MAEYRHQKEQDAAPLRLGRILALGTTALAGLGVGCLAINQTVTKDHWHPPLPRFEEVIAEVEARKDDVDVLFLGPSHMMTNIDPRVFDVRAAELGQPTHSYNFSVESLRVSEREYLLQALKRIAPTKLKYVIVKPDVWLHSDLDNVFSTRTRYFSDPAQTLRDVSVRLRSSQPFFPYRFLTSGAMVLSGLAHVANVGVGAELMLPPKSHLKGPGGERHPERQGYMPYAHEGRHFEQPDSSPYPVKMPSDPVRELAPAELEIIDQLFQGIASLGAKPIVLIPPVGNVSLKETAEMLNALHAHFPDVPVFAYQAGGTTSELYDKLAYWEDLNHLSIEGSRVFSRILAERFVAFVKAEAQR